MTPRGEIDAVPIGFGIAFPAVATAVHLATIHLEVVTAFGLDHHPAICVIRELEGPGCEIDTVRGHRHGRRMAAVGSLERQPERLGDLLPPSRQRRQLMIRRHDPPFQIERAEDAEWSGELRLGKGPRGRPEGELVLDPAEYQTKLRITPVNRDCQHLLGLRQVFRVGQPPDGGGNRFGARWIVGDRREGKLAGAHEVEGHVPLPHLPPARRQGQRDQQGDDERSGTDPHGDSNRRPR